MAETKKETLDRLYRIIDTDATAIAFQTLGQYRIFLRDTVRNMIRECDGETSEREQANKLLPLVVGQSEQLNCRSCRDYGNLTGSQKCAYCENYNRWRAI